MMRGITKIMWLSDGEKMKIQFTRFDRIGLHECDRQPDGQTDRQTPHDSIGRVYA